jgi:hypothetical protein
MTDTLPLINTDEIAENLNDQRSEVADYIQDAKPSEFAPVKPQDAVNIAGQAEVFNPAIHAVDKDGKPKMTLLGKFRRKRVVSHVAKGLPGAKPIGVVNGSLGTNEGQRKMAAKVATDGTFSLGMLLGGASAKPIIDHKIGVDEHQQMFFAWDNYLAAKNINDIPPGVALAIGLSGYAMRVAMLDATRQKTQGFWGKIKDKIVNVKVKKHYATQSLSRDDRERENNTGAAYSGGASEAGRTDFGINSPS